MCGPSCAETLISISLVVKLSQAERRMNDKNVQARMEVSKHWFMRNHQVFKDFDMYLSYDTTSVVSNVLDEGLKVFVFNGDQAYCSLTTSPILLVHCPG
ncbi:hypothetical protein Pmar_PMAR025779 [Perkinsus marinus ATCC 50983]|uniref:Uncharacterized protein n=1 Tax=Perkinsus marinus (strain ATCC 50983 / TXsc) TaxID=423536 RepID=C5L3C9_PERM5|nr:hypothetical protein Pmar_PMAR025779 [Perkinsus marinus ATCC 50983]EER08764.1 hypothetical protein Pmar_PMAR025779 [Perkinsus marinus ATCC 50983]|eukprot:XP_002776948.1 hypothetical protein Pmar_PMAR025779 [Perkinsus marinus ATCC 50983]